MRTFFGFLIISFFFICFGCVPINRQTLAILNCDSGDSINNRNNKLPILLIKKYDILDVIITDATAKASELSPCVNGFIVESGASGGGGNEAKSLMVDENGLLNLNCIGNITANGKSITEIQNEIKTKLKSFITNPLVIVRLKNFKYSVEGEVGAPGLKLVENTRVTILEAIASSGGLKIFAQKDSVYIFRETYTGKIEKGFVNLNNRNIINSPYYYLQQNDYIYVPPTKKRRINEDKTFDRYVGLGVSIVGVITSIVLLITLRNR